MALPVLLRNWLLAFLVPRPIVGIVRLPRYLLHWAQWRQRGGAPLRFADSHPCLGDWTDSTPFDPHYFYQGAWLARQLAAARPARHVDIGSSAMMLSVLSAFTEVSFLDRRPLAADLAGLHCAAGDLCALPIPDASIASLSCLHVIEHVGLGRYGDAVDPWGSRRAAAELVRVLAPGGRLYLSVPVGRERVCFNAHRVFAPGTVLEMLAPLDLVSFALVDDGGRFMPDVGLESAAGLEYGCGMFELTRA